MEEMIAVFDDVDILFDSLGDVGLSHVRIDNVAEGYQVSLPKHVLGSLKQHYAKHMVVKTVSRIPGQSIKRITMKEGKIHIKVSVK